MSRHFARASRALLVCSLALLACGGESAPPASGADGGALADGGSPAADGGNPQSDGGTPELDGGAVTDGGSVVDGGSLADGGGSADGGSLADGGGGADGGSTLADAGPPRTSFTASASIGAGGGTVSVPGIMTLTLPAGALSSTQTITVTPSAAAPPAGLNVLSAIYLFGPSGLTFSTPATLELTTTVPLTDADAPRIYFGDTIAAAAPITTTRTGQTYRAQITHFSAGFLAYAVPATPPPESACVPSGAGTASTLCGGNAATAAPEPWPVELVNDCSLPSPVENSVVYARLRTSGFGVGFKGWTGSLQNVYFHSYDQAGTRTTTTSRKVTSNVIDSLAGADFTEVPGSTDLWFAYHTNGRRPEDPSPPPRVRFDPRIVRTSSQGVALATATIIRYEEPCPAATPDGTPGAPTSPELLGQVRVVATQSGPVIVWLQRVETQCATTNGSNMHQKLRAVWLNNDLSVRVAPMDLTDGFEEVVTDFDVTADAAGLVGIAYIRFERKTPPLLYPNWRVRFRSFLDGQPTASAPIDLAGYPCSQQGDETGLIPNTNATIGCTGELGWGSVSLTSKNGVAVAAFSIGGAAPLHVARVMFTTGATASQPLQRALYGNLVFQRPRLFAADDGYTLVGFTPSVYRVEGGLSDVNVNDGGTNVGGAVKVQRLRDDLLPREQAVTVGVVQFGVTTTPTVATRAGLSLIGWSDYHPPTGGARVRKKAAFLTCPP